MAGENPLVAAPPTESGGSFNAGTGDNGWATGVSIAESAMDTFNGIKDGNWVEAGLGMVGLAADAAAMAIDPFGTLMSSAASFLMEHVQPLKDMLDWLAGDPPVIESYSTTWNNVSAELAKIAEDYQASVKAGTEGWTGSAAETYHANSAVHGDALTGAASAAGTVGTVVGLMGMVVAFVREMVRDLIADLVGKLIAWVLEAVFSLGFGTPVIVAQAVTAISKWAAKIAKIIQDLLNTIKKVSPMLKRLVEVFEKIMKVVGKLAGKATGLDVLDPKNIKKGGFLQTGNTDIDTPSGTPGTGRGGGTGDSSTADTDTDTPSSDTSPSNRPSDTTSTSSTTTTDPAPSTSRPGRGDPTDIPPPTSRPGRDPGSPDNDLPPRGHTPGPGNPTPGNPRGGPGSHTPNGNSPIGEHRGGPGGQPAPGGHTPIGEHRGGPGGQPAPGGHTPVGEHRGGPGGQPAPGGSYGSGSPSGGGSSPSGGGSPTAGGAPNPDASPRFDQTSAATAATPEAPPRPDQPHTSAPTTGSPTTGPQTNQPGPGTTGGAPPAGAPGGGGTPGGGGAPGGGARPGGGAGWTGTPGSRGDLGSGIPTARGPESVTPSSHGPSGTNPSHAGPSHPAAGTPHNSPNHGPTPPNTGPGTQHSGPPQTGPGNPGPAHTRPQGGPTPSPAGSPHASPPHAGPGNPGPAHTRPQGGPTPSPAGPPQAGPPHAGPSHTNPSQPGPAHTNPSQASPPRTNPPYSGPAHPYAPHSPNAPHSPSGPRSPNAPHSPNGPSHTSPSQHTPHNAPPNRGPAGAPPQRDSSPDFTRPRGGDGPMPHTPNRPFDGPPPQRHPDTSTPTPRRDPDAQLPPRRDPDGIPDQRRDADPWTPPHRDPDPHADTDRTDTNRTDTDHPDTDTDAPHANHPDADADRPDIDTAHAQHGETTPAGISHHRGDPDMGDLPHRVPNDPRYFTADVHITPDGRARIGNHTYTPEQYGDLLRRNGWDGKTPIRLIGCDAGSNNFANRLSHHTGADVLAPTKPAWTDTNGRVYTSDAEIGPDGNRQPKIPPNGEWNTHHPNGTTTKTGDDGFAPGTDNTDKHDLDPTDAKDRAARDNSVTDPAEGRDPTPQRSVPWDPPEDLPQVDLDVDPNQRVLDFNGGPPLEPNSRVVVHNPDGSVRGTYYTDANRNVTHVDTAVPNTRNSAGVPVNPDTARPEPGVVYQVDTGISTHTFRGQEVPDAGPSRTDGGTADADAPADRPDAPADRSDAPETETAPDHGPDHRPADRFDDFDQARTPPAVEWDPPGGPDGTYRSMPPHENYNPSPPPDGDGPFSLRGNDSDNPLEPHARYEVYNDNGDWHGTFYTDADGRVSHVHTWSGNSEHGFNPELGTKETWDAGMAVPAPNTTFAVGPRHMAGMEPTVPQQMYRTDVHGDTIAASGRPVYPPSGTTAEDFWGPRRGVTPGSPGEGVQPDTGRIASGGKEGHWVPTAGEYAPANYQGNRPELFRFDGGHIVPFEGGGPGERINHVPQWAFENRPMRVDGGSTDDTWRRMEEDIARRAAVDGTTVDRVDFFAERTTPDIHTPDKLHVRYHFTVSDPPPPRTVQEIRSFHNVPEPARNARVVPPPTP